MPKKHLFKDEKAYTLEIKEELDVVRYFVSFTDSEKIAHKTEVSQDIYDEFVAMQRTVRNLERSDERHISGGGLEDTVLALESIALEDIVTLKTAIESLTPIQRRRFLLYFEHGLNFTEISKMEKCATQTVIESIEGAKKKILKLFL